MKERISNLSKVEKLNYSRQYIAANEKVLDEIFAWIGRQSLSVGYDNGNTYYALDKERVRVVRFNSAKKTIELSDEVDEFTDKGIEHIIKTEIRGADLEC